MSLRDDFENEFSRFEVARDHTGDYVDKDVENLWRGYKLATRRAARIAKEVAFELRGAHQSANATVDKIVRRLKGES